MGQLAARVGEARPPDLRIGSLHDRPRATSPARAGAAAQPVAPTAPSAAAGRSLHELSTRATRAAAPPCRRVAAARRASRHHRYTAEAALPAYDRQCGGELRCGSADRLPAGAMERAGVPSGPQHGEGMFCRADARVSQRTCSQSHMCRSRRRKIGATTAPSTHIPRDVGVMAGQCANDNGRRGHPHRPYARHIHDAHQSSLIPPANPLIASSRSYSPSAASPAGGAMSLGVAAATSPP
jgi:hypothetical protein